MKTIISFIKQGWLISLIGIIALSFLVLFLVEFFGQSDVTKWSIIGGLFSVWGLYYLWKVYNSRKQNQQLLAQLAEEQKSPDDIATEEEIEHLDSRLQEAVQALKGLRLKGESDDKHYIYQLPWYIIIGPPGSGKTTLLSNSNLKFPLSKKFGKEALLGVGGTRNCDWWFTNDAVLLDTAGRYTTQDSNEIVDQGAWFGFLDLLKKYRGHQAVNGVMIAVSLDDLIRLSPDEREKHATAIRQRIAELYEQLNISIPVYMMFTKADLVAGFSEFFDDLNRNEREQVWGVTFPHNESCEISTVDMFAGEFSLLEQRIHQQLIKKLDAESNVEKRQAIYSFPSQFSSLKNPLNQFLNDIFGSDKFTVPFMLRGVYFTSATQEGTPIDRIMGSLASGFGIAREHVSSYSGKGKSYFINHLLKEVIFSEAGLAGTNQKLARRMQWVQLATAASIGIASLLLAGLWLNSYQQNKRLIEDDYSTPVKKMAGLKAYKSKKLSDQLSFLDNLAEITRKDEKLSFFDGLGLYQGKSIADQARYQESLEHFFSPLIKEKLENLMEEQSEPLNAPELFNTLKAYVYLSKENKPSDMSDYQPPVFTSVDWGMDEQNKAFDHHLTELVKTEPNIRLFKVDQELLSQARSKLSDKSTDIVYSKIKNMAEKLPPFDMKNGQLSNINSYFEAKNWKIYGLYTVNGYENIFIKNYKRLSSLLVEDKWVMGKESAGFSIDKNIDKLLFSMYQTDYVKKWNNYLNNIRIKKFTTNKEAATNINNIVEHRIINNLVEAIHKQTDFSEINKVKNYKIGLKKEAEWVTGEFSVYKALLADKNDKLESLNNSLKSVASGITRGNKEDNKVKEAIEDLRNVFLSDAIPTHVEIWFSDFTRELGNKVDKDIEESRKGETKKVFKQRICSFAREKFDKKHPFKGNSKVSVEPSDFSSFFKPDGRMDNFSKEHLTQKKSVKLAEMPLLQKMYKDADSIQKFFFPIDSLNYQFKLTLHSSPPATRELQLSMGGMKPTSFNLRSSTSKEARSFKWEGLSSLQTVAIYNNNSRKKSPESKQDAWQLFRWVSKNRLVIPIQQSHDRIIFDIDPSPDKILKTLGHFLKACESI